MDPEKGTCQVTPELFLTMKRTFLIVATVVVGIALGVGVAAYVVDLHMDREAIVRVTGPVRVYDRESPPGYKRGDDGMIRILQVGDTVTVIRIHERDGVESIHVRLRDGREGYIFCCDDFELSR